MNINQIALTESSALRENFTDVSVLDHVGEVPFLPGEVYLTTELVSSFYEVDKEVIQKTVQRHRSELENNGLRVLRGDDLKRFKEELAGHKGGQDVHLSRTNQSLFTRRTVLNIGMLLRDSEKAKLVRHYLLNAEELLPEKQKKLSYLRARLSGIETRKSFMATLKVVHEVDGTSVPFNRWAATFTKLLTKNKLKITEVEFKSLKSEGKGNARNGMTEDQIQKMDVVENFAVAYINNVEPLNIQMLYQDLKGVLNP